MNRNFFAGTCTLLRFILRRDRLRISIWLAALVGFSVAFVPVFGNLLVSGEGNSVFAAMMQNPALVAMVGPVYGTENFHTGAAYATMMLVFSVILAGIMNIFLIIRHTRQDEELGRLEVIRSLPVGRLANLSSALLAALLANLVLFLLTGFGMYAVREEGMTLAGCLLFGAAMGVIGLFFAAATAVFCQITSNSRTASGFSFIFLMILYIMRAAGDISSELLSRISPLGLILRTQIFVKNYLWPIWIILSLSVILTAVALVLNRIRDLGQGLISAKPGRRHAHFTLSSPYGLAWYLLRTSTIIWSITVFSLAAMYGSVFGELESFIGSNEMLKAMFASREGFSVTEQFIGLITAIMSMVAAIPILSAVHRIPAEERRGHTEHLLGRSVSRYQQMAAYLIPGLLMSVVFQFLTALGFWSMGSAVLETAPSLSTFVIASFSYIPALWMLAAISMILAAFLPGKTFISFIYLGYTFFTIYLGTLINLPEWTRKLTPFGYVPQYPVEDLEPFNFIALVLISAVLVVIAFLGYRRRDTQTQ